MLLKDKLGKVYGSDSFDNDSYFGRSVKVSDAAAKRDEDFLVEMREVMKNSRPIPTVGGIIKTRIEKLRAAILK